MRCSQLRRCLGLSPAVLACFSALPFLIAASPALAQFVDDCGSAPQVTEGLHAFDLTFATAGSTPFSACANTTATIDQWIRYVPTFSGYASISTLGLSTGDTVLSVHSAFNPEFDCAFAPFQVIACNDDLGSPQSRVIISVTSGQAVLVRIAGGNDTRPTGSVLIESFTPLAGDTCATALPAVDGVNVYDVTQAVVNGFAGTCTGFRDVYYTYTPSVTGGLTVSTCGQPTTANLSIFANCTGTVLGCVYGECTVSSAVEAGVPVIIRIANEDATTPEQFIITVNPAAIPSNDDCTNPTVAMLGQNPFDNTFATVSPNPTCGFGGPFAFQEGIDVWFSFVPTVSGTYDFSTEESTGISNTILGLYTSCSQEPFACSDDGRGFLSFIRVPLTANTQYLIKVAGAGIREQGTPDARGPGVLTIRRSIAPSNDLCSTPTTITPGTHAYNIYDATTGDETVSCVLSQFATQHDVWYRVVPTTTGLMEASLDPTGAAAHLSIYDTCTGSPRTAGLSFDLTSYQDTVRIVFPVQAGTPFLIRIAYLLPEGELFPASGSGQFYVGPVTVATPANDNCADATPILPGTTSINLTGSIKDCTAVRLGSDDAAVAASDNDIFFRYTAVASELVSVTITDGSDYPEYSGIVVSVYNQCGGTRLATSLEFGGAPKNSVAFDAVAGQQYIIRVASVLRFGQTPVYSGSITLGAVVRCSPADIAYGDGEPLPPIGVPGGFNPVGPDGGDFDCFFNFYFAPAPDNIVCDIAYGDGEPLPPFGLPGGFNPGVDGGDFDCFFNYYFNGCL